MLNSYLKSVFSGGRKTWFYLCLCDLLGQYPEGMVHQILLLQLGQVAELDFHQESQTYTEKKNYIKGIVANWFLPCLLVYTIWVYRQLTSIHVYGFWTSYSRCQPLFVIIITPTLLGMLFPRFGMWLWTFMDIHPRWGHRNTQFLAAT